MIIIKDKVLKVSIIALLVGISVPNNIFVYGTSDTEYTDTVSSTIDMAEFDDGTIIESDNQYINSDIASVLGIDTSDTERMLYAKEYVEHGVIINCTENEEIEANIDNMTEISTDEIDIVDDNNIINLQASASDNVIEQEKTSYVALEDLSVYAGASADDIVYELKEGDEIEVTNIVIDGYTLIYSDDSDAWVEQALIGDKSEINKHKQENALLEIENPDVNYNPIHIELAPEDRDLCERLVMGEAGGQGYEGAALVAQAIRDAMMFKGFSSVAEVRTSMGYTGSINTVPNQDVLDAVAFIFDEDGYAVRHKVLYFYAFNTVKSAWHESQVFVIQYKGHRFFSSK